LELQQDEMGIEMVMEMTRLMMEEMMPCLPMIRVAARMVPSASSSSRSLPGVRFMRFLVALNVGSQIRIRMVNVFDEAESVPHGMGAWYGQVLPEPEVIKTSKVDSRIALSPQVHGKSFK
jgi:hypothetical protein